MITEDEDLLHAISASAGGMGDLRNMCGLNGALLFPELRDRGPFIPLRLLLNADDQAFFLQRGPSGVWAGVATSPYDYPERLDHLRAFGIMKAVVDEGLVQDRYAPEGVTAVP